MNYLEKLSNCYPDSEAYVVGTDDPNIYTNLIWLTAQIPQATLDGDTCPVQPSDVLGGQNIFQATFVYKGDIYNKWIGTESSLTSDETPYIIPWKCVIVGLGFSNEEEDANIDAQIFKADLDAGSTNGLVIQWDIRNSRTAFKTDVPSGLTFEVGDKMGVFFKKYNNNKPKNVQFVVYFQIDVNTTVGENSESFTGDF